MSTLLFPIGSPCHLEDRGVASSSSDGRALGESRRPDVGRRVGRAGPRGFFVACPPSACPPAFFFFSCRLLGLNSSWSVNQLLHSRLAKTRIERRQDRKKIALTFIALITSIRLIKLFASWTCFVGWDDRKSCDVYLVVWYNWTDCYCAFFLVPPTAPYPRMIRVPVHLWIPRSSLPRRRREMSSKSYPNLQATSNSLLPQVSFFPNFFRLGPGFGHFRTHFQWFASVLSLVIAIKRFEVVSTTLTTDKIAVVIKGLRLLSPICLDLTLLWDS